MIETGNQYPNDDKTDPSGFLRRARLHQSVFRAEYLKLPFETYGNYLKKEDGAKGKNFYDGFGVFDAVVKRYRKYSKSLYSNMLRSEHIPFNLFVPLKQNLKFCKQVFNEILGSIDSIDKIKIEYAPSPKEKYLNDRTSFDTYIEYTHTDKSKGVIGIEVKYTEKEYPLKKKSKQYIDINDEKGKYHSVTKECGIYKPNVTDKLKTDLFRQIWRNHLLAESLLIVEKDKFKHAHSLIFYPEDNNHFEETGKEYSEMLLNNDDNKFKVVTFESFIENCKKHSPDERFDNWINYLQERYIISTRD